MRAAERAAALAGIALAISCGAPDEERRPLPAEPALRLVAPVVVRWEPGRARHVDFAIENSTSRTVTLAAPDPANARVELFGPESVRLCGLAPPGRPAHGARVALAPGDRVEVRVELESACRSLGPGEYRYEVSYRAGEPSGPPAAPGAPPEARTFTGTLPTQYGKVVVAPPVSAACEVPGAPGAVPQARAEPPERGRAPPERHRPATPREPR